MDERPSAPPDAIRAWMDRLTVAHEYDPETGFIVAREVVQLPTVVASAPPLRETVAIAQQTNRPAVIFATADRCAPCQQYKRDAINNERVIARLSGDDLLVTHVEVDRETDAAREILGSLGIPMTYVIKEGAIVATLRGQRSADDLLAWLDDNL